MSLIAPLLLLALQASGSPAPAGPPPAQLHWRQAAPVGVREGGADCDPDGPATVTRLAPGGLRYCGRIDAEGVRRATALLAAADTRLVITSTGGTLQAPLALADLVVRHRLAVEAAGPCFSACASIVFVAAEQRIVSPTGVLGFHNSNSSAFLLATRNVGGRGAEGLDALQRRASEETRLYALRGVDPTLLIRPQAEIETICIADTGREADRGERVFNLISELDLWVPDRATLGDYGLAFTGTYPADRREVDRRLAAFFPTGTRLRIRFGGRDVPASILYRHLYATPVC